MNPWSLTAYSVSKLGAWIQEKTRRWASELVPSVPCMDSGVSCAQFLVLFLTRNVFSLSLKKQKNAAVRDDLTTDTNYKSSEATRRRGVALLRREPYLEQKRFLPFPPVSPSLSTFGKELEYRKWIKLRGWQLLLQRLHRCRGDCKSRRERNQAERTRVSVQSCSESLCSSLACLIVKEGGGWRKSFICVRRVDTLWNSYDRNLLKLWWCVFDISGIYIGCQRKEKKSPM